MVPQLLLTFVLFLWHCTMHASHVAILVLAVSAASPVVSAPLVPAGVSRGFLTSVFSNANKGTKAVKRDVPLDNIQVSDVHVQDIIRVMKGLFGDVPVDDVQARGFDTSILSNRNKGTQALGARRNPVRPGDVKAIIGTVKSLAGLLVRDDVDDSVLEGTFLQAISRRSVSELEARGEVSSIFQAVKDIIQVLSRRDVTPEQLIALASLASSPLNSLD
ncbi:hypothetical protein EDB84DRAFT_545461 [Lactarius hengduanensis]|nr:hypothetical protein EDB84DRAFT_545461 [Lactarius hengduanensis]